MVVTRERHIGRWFAWEMMLAGEMVKSELQIDKAERRQATLVVT